MGNKRFEGLEYAIKMIEFIIYILHIQLLSRDRVADDNSLRPTLQTAAAVGWGKQIAGNKCVVIPANKILPGYDLSVSTEKNKNITVIIVDQQ